MIDKILFTLFFARLEEIASSIMRHMKRPVPNISKMKMNSTNWTCGTLKQDTTRHGQSRSFTNNARQDIAQFSRTSAIEHEPTHQNMIISRPDPYLERAIRTGIFQHLSVLIITSLPSFASVDWISLISIRSSFSFFPPESIISTLSFFSFFIVPAT